MSQPGARQIVQTLRHCLTEASYRALGVQLRLRAYTREPSGQGMAEFALILALVAVLCVAALTLFGREIGEILLDIAEHVEEAADPRKPKKPKRHLH